MSLIGSVEEYYGDVNNIPPDYVIADGRDLLVSQYPYLFAKIGYRFGGSDGVFKVPDRRMKAAIGAMNNHDVGVTEGANEIYAHDSSISAQDAYNYRNQMQTVTNARVYPPDKSINEEDAVVDVIHALFIIKAA